MEEAMKVCVKSFLLLGIINCGIPIFASSTDNKPATQQIMPSSTQSQSVTVPAKVFDALMRINNGNILLGFGVRNTLTPEQIEAAEKRVISESLAIIKSYINDPNTTLNAPAETEVEGERLPFVEWLMLAMSQKVPELTVMVKTLLNNKNVAVTSAMLFYSIDKNEPELFEILLKRGAQPTQENLIQIKDQIEFLEGKKGAIEKETLDQWRDILKKLEKSEKDNKSTSTSTSSSASSSSSSQKSSSTSSATSK